MASNKNSRELDELRVSLLDYNGFLKGIIEAGSLSQSMFFTPLEILSVRAADADESHRIHRII